MKKWFTLVVAVGLLGFTACSGGSSKDRTPSVSKGKEGDKLQMMPVSDVTVDAGKTAKVTVKIDRKDFNEPVKIELSDLPKDVKADDMTKTIDKDDKEATFTLTAGDKADAVKTTAKVTASAKDMKTSKEFKVEVKKK